MNFQQFATSRFGTSLWIGLARSLPPRAGYALAQAVTGVLSRRVHSGLYRALYANQSVVLGPATPPEMLDCAVHEVLAHAAVSSYDLIHLLAKGEDALRATVEMGPSIWADIAAAHAGGHGVMACAAHISNFNLGLIAFALHGLPMQILSPPGKHGGFEIVGRLRSQGMLEDTPVDAQALKAAIRRLHGGGMVLTGVDWPEVSVEKEVLPFFGREAHLPTGHIRLAISTGARLLPVACRWDPRRGYYVETAAPLDLELSGDRAQDVRHNARRVLAVLERWIAERPEQWLMYHPVWEDIPEAEF
jgi:lauroyl/myristoyl acyltransferase